jgi:hypothetical protein
MTELKCAMCCSLYPLIMTSFYIQFSLVYVTKKYYVLFIFSNRRIITSFNYDKILGSV